MKQEKALAHLKNSKVDVFFIQEMDVGLLKEIEKRFRDEYYVNHKAYTFSTSAILIKRDKFPEIKDFREENYRFQMKYFDRCNANPDIDLNWNDDTVYQFAGQYLFISPHLSSKKEPNKEQVQMMKNSLTKLKKNFPKLRIVAAGDYNGYIEHGFMIQTEPDKSFPIYVFPDAKTTPTCNKKRTLIQAQKNKANVLSKEAKDYIISTEKLTSERVLTMSGVDVQKIESLPLLPNSEHPYDHYLIVATL